MRYNYQLKKRLFIATGISSVLTILFSYMQIRVSNYMLFAIVNNVAICVLTGCVITLIQAIIGFQTAKKEAVLEFYKNTLILEKKVFDHSVLGRGFSLAKKGYAEIMVITEYFNNEVKLSYMKISKAERSDKVILAVNDIFDVYNALYIKYHSMEEILGKAVNYMELSDEEIKAYGIDEPSETRKHNAQLKSSIESIEKELGDSKQRSRLQVSYNVLESYLFEKGR